jgi:hypothetical protein
MSLKNFSVLISFSTLFFVFVSCVKTTRKINIVNETADTIYYEVSSDSSFDRFYHNIKLIKQSFQTDTLTAQKYFTLTCTKHDTSSKILHFGWPGPKNYDFLWIFILDNSKKDKQINNISDLKTAIKYRKQCSIKDLKHDKWLIHIW